MTTLLPPAYSTSVETLFADEPAPTTLNRNTLASQLAEKLTQRILQGEYPPASLLPAEQAVAREFGVSRPVVREAIRELSGRGLVRVINHIGAEVQPINTDVLKLYFERALHADPGSWREIMDVRRVLEARSVALAARNRTEEDIRILRQLVEIMRRSANKPADHSAADLRIHLEIGRISGNSFILHLISSIQDTLVLIIKALHAELLDDSLPVMCKLHEEIVDALEAGDEERAVDAMEVHFENALERLEPFITRKMNREYRPQ
ncbi:MAG: FadR family transcriptional regulator [Spirochaetaceae bacterium]|nr:MAG: FadR family transcriptional regulator [Spirochaetaceae bacterium]